MGRRLAGCRGTFIESPTHQSPTRKLGRAHDNRACNFPAIMRRPTTPVKSCRRDNRSLRSRAGSACHEDMGRMPMPRESRAGSPCHGGGGLAGAGGGGEGGEFGDDSRWVRSLLCDRGEFEGEGGVFEDLVEDGSEARKGEGSGVGLGTRRGEGLRGCGGDGLCGGSGRLGRRVRSGGTRVGIVCVRCGTAIMAVQPRSRGNGRSAGSGRDGAGR